MPERTVFEKLVQVLVFCCAYWRIADESRSATTLRRQRDEWIEGGVMDALRKMASSAYDRTIGIELADVAVDCCITRSLVVASGSAEARWTGESKASNARLRCT